MSNRDKRYTADVTIIGDIISTVPVTDDKGNSYDDARRILNSDWLAARDARMKAEALEGLASEIAEVDRIERKPWVEVTDEERKAYDRYFAAHLGKGRLARASWLRARAAEYRAERSPE